MSDLVHEVHKALRSLGVHAQKRRGQNFMVSRETLDLVAAAAAPQAGETVLEIGPGLGFLTDALLSRGARVVAVEKDYVLARRLSALAASRPLTLLEKDILEIDPASLDLPPRFRVAGNIPYNITSPILEWLVDNRARVSEAVLTVQREVANRLGAKPGGKTWGSLSVFVQTYASVEILRVVPPGAFHPAPKVESAVVRLVFSEKPRHAVGDEAAYFFLVRRAFQKRRKTLLNALEGDEKGLSKKEVAEALADAGIDSMRRPETLSLEDWGRLSALLKPPAR